MELQDSTAVQLLARSLGEDGELAPSLLAERAVHCGLLVDLAAVGALTDEADAEVVDVSRSAHPLADAMAREMAEHPDRELRWWMQNGGPGIHDAAGALVQAGLWREHRALVPGVGPRRYAWAPDAGPVRDHVLAVVGPSWEAGDHSRPAPHLALAAGLYGHQPQRPPDEELAALAGPSWLVRQAVDYLVDDATWMEGGIILD